MHADTMALAPLQFWCQQVGFLVVENSSWPVVMQYMADAREMAEHTETSVCAQTLYAASERMMMQVNLKDKVSRSRSASRVISDTTATRAAMTSLSVLVQPAEQTRYQPALKTVVFTISSEP